MHLPTPVLFLCLVFITAGLVGCSNSGSDDSAPTPAPVALTYDLRVSDVGTRNFSEEAQEFERFTPILADVVVKNQSSQSVTFSGLSLRITDVFGQDVTPHLLRIASPQDSGASQNTMIYEPPVIIPSGGSYQWSDVWYQVNNRATQVSPGDYTLSVIAYDEDGFSQPRSVASRTINIRKSVRYSLVTSAVDPLVPRGMPVEDTTSFEGWETVYLSCTATNHGAREFTPRYEYFSVFNEQTGVTTNNRWANPPVVGYPLAPGESMTFYDSWDHFSDRTSPDSLTTSTSLVPHFPTPGWYRIDIQRMGVVIASRRIYIRNSVVIATNG